MSAFGRCDSSLFFRSRGFAPSGRRGGGGGRAGDGPLLGQHGQEVRLAVHAAAVQHDVGLVEVEEVAVAALVALEAVRRLVGRVGGVCARPRMLRGRGEGPRRQADDTHGPARAGDLPILAPVAMAGRRHRDRFWGLGPSASELRNTNRRVAKQ